MPCAATGAPRPRLGRSLVVECQGRVMTPRAVRRPEISRQVTEHDEPSNDPDVESRRERGPRRTSSHVMASRSERRTRMRSIAFLVLVAVAACGGGSKQPAAELAKPDPAPVAEPTPPPDPPPVRPA